MKKLYLILGALLTMASSTYAQIGSVDHDLVFTPVTPCRIFDTRTSQGGTGPIATGGTKSFDIYPYGSATNFAYQGGNSTGNCGVIPPANVAAVALSMAVVSPSGQGYLTAYPYGTTRPLASSLNYNAGEVVVSNAATLKVTNGLYGLTIFASTGTEVIADVVGYYSRPVATALNCVSVPGAGLSVGANVYTSVPIASCAAGFASVGVDFAAGARVVKADSGLNYLYVLNLNSIAQTVTPYTNCCRIPGR